MLSTLIISGLYETIYFSLNTDSDSTISDTKSFCSNKNFIYSGISSKILGYFYVNSFKLFTIEINK